MIKFITCIILLSFLLTQCKKDHTPIKVQVQEETPVVIPEPETPELIPCVDTPCDTVTPLCYYPAYPGSWWVYTDDSGNVTLRQAGPEYIATAWHIDCDSTINQFVPRAPIGRIHEYSFFEGCNGCTKLTPFLSFTEGETWFDCPALPLSHEIKWQYYVETVDTSFAIGGVTYDSIVKMRHGYWYDGQLQGSLHAKYYACGVGIILEEYYNGVDTTRKELTSYFINN